MAKECDARAWALWAAVAGLLAMLVRNPLYALLLILAARLVDSGSGRPERGLQLPWARLAVTILLLATLFNVLFVHSGATVLARLPAGWPLIGGPLTMEAAVYGLTTGLVLLALLFVFVTFNHVVPASQLIRLTPRAFHDLGVVLLIAFTYVPETARHLRQVREAQAIRGHRVRGLLDWQPLLVPLLVGGMERAMGLAEAMVARGYGATAGKQQQPAVLAGLAGGLLLLLTGWLLAFWYAWAGWLLFVAGFLLLSWLLWRRGRTVPHTRYRPQAWQRRDSLLLLASLLPLGLALWQRELLGYNPYPRLYLPPFDPLLGTAFLLLALPGLLCPRSGTRPGGYHDPG